LHNQKPRHVLGNFHNGYLDGHVKALLQTNQTLISQFKNGLANGLRRVWDTNGELIYVGAFVDGFKVGKCFTKAGKFISISNCSIFDNNFETALAINIDGNNEDATYLGKLLPFAASLELVQKVAITRVEKAEDSCLMDIGFLTLDGIFYFFKNCIFLSLPSEARSLKFHYGSRQEVLSVLPSVYHVIILPHL